MGRTILMCEPAVGVGAHHIDAGSDGDLAGQARADFEIGRPRARPVDHVIAVSGHLRKRRAIAGAQLSLTIIPS